MAWPLLGPDLAEAIFQQQAQAAKMKDDKTIPANDMVDILGPHRSWCEQVSMTVSRHNHA
jgi:hypothetical protein